MDTRKYLILFIFAILPFANFSEEPSCVRDIERSFFNPQIVSQALAFHEDIFQSSWTEINRLLHINAANISKIVHERSERMNPNPFNIPIDYEEGAKLVKQVLFDVFSQTLLEFNITNLDKITEIFNYIFDQQKQKWIDCFGEEKSNAHK